MPLLAHPTSHVLTPFLLLHLAFGPQIGSNLEIVAHVAIAWAGAYLLARFVGLGTVGQLTCASVFTGSSWFYLHVAVGHLNFLPEAFLPWIVALVWIGIARKTITPLWLAGAILAVMLGEGGVYACTQAIIIAGLVASSLAVKTRRLWPVAGVITACLFGAGLGAVKLLASWQFIGAHPRKVAELEYNPVFRLLAGLFARNQFYDAARMGEWGWWESGAYLGPIFFGFAILGAVFRFRRATPWVFAAAVLFVLALGAPYPWMPWALIHHLPIMSAERVPNRFLIPFMLPVGICAGFGADFLFRIRSVFGPTSVSALLIIAVLDQWTVSRPNLAAPVAGDLPQIAWSPEFHQVFLDTWSMAVQSMSNEGAVHCNEELDYHDVTKVKVIGSNQLGYRGEQYEIDGGTVNCIEWTPNQIGYSVSPSQPTIVVVNENYDPGWTLVEGSGTVVQWNGLIGISVPPGDQRITIGYQNRLFSVGAYISLLTLAVGLLLSFWIDKRTANRKPVQNEPSVTQAGVAHPRI